jgi:hypothetical protein
MKVGKAKTSRIAAAVGLAFVGTAGGAWGQTCPQTSAEVTHGSPELQTFAAAGAGGVIYDTLGTALTLNRSAGSISDEIPVGVFDTSGAAITPVSSAQPAIGCGADFFEDGYDDYVGATDDVHYVGFWRNDTADNYNPLTADWADPSFTLTPKFTFTGWFSTATTYYTGGSATACGDFNGDGHADFLLVAEQGGTGATPYRADLFRGNGDGTFQAPYQFVTTIDFPLQGLRRDAMGYPTDYDSDGDLDFILAKRNTSTSGRIRVFLNSGGATPMFNATNILTDVPIGDYGTSAVTYLDLNRDGVKDLATGGVDLRGVRILHGLSGGGFASAVTISDTDWPTGSFPGMQSLVGGDFDLDGYNDLLVGTNLNGGHVFVWRDNGPPDYVTNHQADFDLLHPSFTDTDLGFALDYDNDPAGTLDFMMGDNGNAMFMFANRLYPQYVSCAEIASDPLDLGSLSTAQLVVTAARINPTATIPSGTTITWSMSNEEPANWQPANPCVDDNTEFCVAFPQPTGRSVRWRAELCTNLAHTLAPAIDEVRVKFDYTVAANHYRAGVVVNHGVAYVGGFEQPGDGGHFYAINAGTDLSYWDAAQKLDQMPDSARTMYTTAIDGTTRLPFDATGALAPAMLETLNVDDAAAALDVITWQRSARFGIGGSSKLGAVLTSTPAVISPPQRPYYYNQLSPAEKTKFDTFMSTHRNRKQLILFGSKDGAVHAIQNNLTTITPNDTTSTSDNGKEVWAFIPHRVANGFLTDKTNGSVTSYPDGSPTLADVKIGTEYRTIAVFGSGNGGKAFTALDVTDTFGATVTGPIPLWDYVPGGANAGQANSKPTIIRVKINAAERFIAVLATGVAYDNMTAPYAKGLDVEGVDIATGNRLWRFRSVCPVSTDVIAFETDDVAEPGSPSVDGFVDRVVFADLCGNVYKVDPAQEILGPDPDDGWAEGIGSVTTGAVDPAGNPVVALWSVADSTLAEERPIAGTIGTRPDETGRRVLFFGTGGTESYDVLKRNGFFSVYVDDGSIRDEVLGTSPCPGANGECEKFYGGIVVTPEQVLVTRAIDPPIATSSCDTGSSQILALDVQDLSQQFVVGQTSSVVSSLFGDQGALYATTLSGEVVRVGTPTQADATTDDPTGTPNNGDETQPVKRRTWRELLY